MKISKVIFESKVSHVRPEAEISRINKKKLPTLRVENKDTNAIRKKMHE